MKWDKWVYFLEYTNIKIVRDLLCRMYMRLVGSIQQLRISVVRIGKVWNHAAQQIPTEEKYSRNTPTIKIFHYFFMVLHQALRKPRQDI